MHSTWKVDESRILTRCEVETIMADLSRKV